MTATPTRPPTELPGYTQRDLSFSALAANGYALVVMLPVVVLLAVPFFLIRVVGNDSASFALDGFGWLVGLYAALIGGIIVHELIHGVTWAVAGRKPWSAITFGVQWKTLTPYAHVKEPLPVGPYRLGAAMPGLLLGGLPVALATITGSGWLLAFGLLFTFAAGGDALVLWSLRGVRGDALVEDHPTRAGCYVLEPVEARAVSG